MTALKPCPNPKCGGTARLIASGGGSLFVSCLSADCQTWGPSNDDDGAKWNDLPRPADIVAARIEGLREAMAKDALAKRKGEGT